MAGRAGRAGIDTHGECVLINQEIGVVVGEKLFTSGASPVQSCLVDGKKGAWLPGCWAGCAACVGAGSTGWHVGGLLQRRPTCRLVGKF